MNKRSTTLYFFGTALGMLLLGLLSSCEEPVDPGFEIQEPELVVSSTFFPDDVVKVRLSATHPTGGELLITDISDATVAILEGDQTAEQLVYVPGDAGRPGNYQSIDFRPEVGRVYTLFATKSGYEPFEAASSIPEAATITELKGEIVNSYQSGDLMVYDFDLTINYEDPPFTENFYDVRISQMVTPFYINSAGDTALLDGRAKVVQAVEVAGDENTGPGETSILVRDRPAGDGVKLRLQSRIDPRREILGELFAELRTVSPAYYNYQINFRREGQALPIGLGDPQVNVNSIGNARRGVGVFGGYNLVVRSFPLTY